MTTDPYLIPGTDTLRNRLRMTDAVGLASAEEDVASVRITELVTSAVSVKGRWDLAHLQSVHRYIFGDV